MELNQLKNRYNTLKQHRELFMTLWQDISENMSPSSGFFSKDKGDKKRTMLRPEKRCSINWRRLKMSAITGFLRREGTFIIAC